MAESSRRTDESLERALALATDALRATPAGLLTDFDGTLSPIVSDPSRAHLVDGASTPLRSLARRLAVVAIVTGRAPMDARQMIGVPELLIAGNHGTEWLEPGVEEPSPSPDAARLRLLLDSMLDRVPLIDGVVIEHKGVSASVHYRKAADRENVRATVLRALGAPPPGIELGGGKMIIELRPVGMGNKGTATRTIIERFGLRGAVVMGDDLTDLDMFAAVADARAAGRLQGVIVGVGGADERVPSEVAGAADVVLPDVDATAAFLARLATVLA
ncbi:MAG TPA: trehalose-phosphatase [Candidatus Limnocylindria bacterium]